MPPLGVVVILALAAFRVVRLVTADSTLNAPRDRMYRWAWDDEHPVADPARDVFVPSPRGSLRTWAYELVTCTYCFGVWASAALYCVWRWGGDVGRGILTAVAIMGLQAILSAVMANKVDEQ